jgi:hypothetical protein
MRSVWLVNGSNSHENGSGEEEEAMRDALVETYDKMFNAVVRVRFEHGPMIVHLSRPLDRAQGRYCVTHEPTGRAVCRTHSLALAKRVANALGDHPDYRKLKNLNAAGMIPGKRMRDRMRAARDRAVAEASKR